MIQLPDQQDIDQLSDFNEPYCLTIYLPMAEPYATLDAYRIHIKNALKEGEAALLDSGLKPKDVEDFLRPTRLLLEEYEARQFSQSGVALFIHPKLFRYYYIPDHSVPRIVSVKAGFDVGPIKELIEKDKHYYVLMLGHKYVRLYEGDHFELKPVHLKDFPANMKETLHIDEYPQSRETHTIAPASTGKGSEAYHEQFDVSKTDKEMLLRFFRWIDHRLHNFLQYHKKPLVVAGVDYLIPIYKKVNTYQQLVTTPIIGNQDIPDLRMIRERAWKLVKNG